MVTRTVVFPIHLTKEQKVVLKNTLELYGQAWQHCVDVAWGMQKASAIDVHKATYKVLRKKLNLKSQYLCSARNRAVETIKSVMVLKRNGKKVCKPKLNRVPMRLDARTLSFDKPREHASVTTQSRRIKIPLYWHKQAEKYRTWFCKAGEIGKNRKGNWVLRLIFEKKVVRPARTKNVVGVDRGIRRAIVAYSCSTSAIDSHFTHGSMNKFIGKKGWKEHERKLLSLRFKLQSKGTKSAHRHLKKLSGRLRRFKENCDRIVAKDLLVNLQAGDTIVLECLTDIRKHCGEKGKACKKHRSNMGRWSFKRLENAINYGAELKGIYVEYVEPHYTSQMCSRCAVVCKKNRKNQSLYSCSCGLTLNADLNAARNIANKWRVANGDTFGLFVNQPIVANYI